MGRPRLSPRRLPLSCSPLVSVWQGKLSAAGVMAELALVVGENGMSPEGTIHRGVIRDGLDHPRQISTDPQPFDATALARCSGRGRAYSAARAGSYRMPAAAAPAATARAVSKADYYPRKPWKNRRRGQPERRSRHRGPGAMDASQAPASQGPHRRTTPQTAHQCPACVPPANREHNESYSR
jgi:hypothetical protein